MYRVYTHTRPSSLRGVVHADAAGCAVVAASALSTSLVDSVTMRSMVSYLARCGFGSRSRRFELMSAPGSVSSSGDVTMWTRLCSAYWSADQLKNLMCGSMRRDFHEPLPRKSSRISVRMRPGLSPYTFTTP